MLRYLSFRTLLIIGFALVALTPSAALVQLRYGLAGLTIQAQQQQEQASAWSNASQQTQEQALHLERASRQLLILPETTFFNAAHSANAKLEAAQKIFMHEPLLKESSESISQLLAQIAANTRQHKSQVNRLFSQLNEQLKNQDQLIELQLAKQRLQWLESVHSKQKQVDMLAILSPIAALSMAIIMAVMFSRPIARLKLKITQLAQGQRGQDWQLSGPADLQGLAKSLAELDLRLVQLEAQKAQFFRHVSHELKTPLAVIHEASALLQEEVLGSLNTQQKEISAMVQSNVQTLRQRVDALLAHDAGRWLSAELVIAPLLLEPFLAQRLQQWRLLLTKKSLRISLSGLASPSYADHAKLGIILDNLLVNAIRFSPAHSEIIIRYGQDGPQSWLEIQDQGPGVNSEDTESIFEPFHCGPAPKGEPAGSGIGLTMARSFAQLMHGDVELLPSSTGACFRLHWQLAQGHIEGG
ncbi:MAG: HAMP domain-containing sensor histidine kinase [Proteobacteria bacterium]|nr:HAMP domain-containing sensor histidine kinase [Pseudomonadota bacterium]